MGLFALVVSYQLLPRRREQPLSSLHALAPSQSQTLPLLTRLRTRCGAFLRTVRRTPGSSSLDEQPRAHLKLHSLSLIPDRRRHKEAMQQTFKSTLRLNVELPGNNPFKEQVHARTPTHTYKRLQDDEERLLKPDIAVISPWSLSDKLYPPTPPPIFTATAGPSSPPPAYYPSTPLRDSFQSRGCDSPTTRDRPPTPFPFLSDGKNCGVSSDGHIEIPGVVQPVTRCTREWMRQSSLENFVVGYAEEDEAEGDANSELDT